MGQVPFVAGLPFFIVIGWGSFISTFFLSLRQYPSTAKAPSFFKSCGRLPGPVNRFYSTFGPIQAARGPNSKGPGPHGPARVGRGPISRLGLLRPETTPEAAMVFLTEFLGAAVIDTHQRGVGRVRDVTVRVQEPYPIVTGIV